ncbi:HNH endonuclease [Pedobacter sp. SYSU D00535]|uniref:HNH endonuclease n=1 Tax=Pedobacter sp. SYSU D00535 TaxID=2810308 RepID=UPI001A95715B|nr:HNH endonuclease [Pedobacter sp. SYSU D00535]
MRPIEKGKCPQIAGTDKVVTEYGQWRSDLCDRIGEYCVYCNMPINHALQVEHVVPKVPVSGAPAGAKLAWDNMVLACGPCNRAKSNKTSNISLHYLPESHNTHLPFAAIAHSTIPKACIIAPAIGLKRNQLTKAKRTIKLLNLHVVDERDKIVDLRWKKRAEAQLLVNSLYDMLQSTKVLAGFDEDKFAKNIALVAKGCGFFSLWYTAFENEPKVMEKLTDNTIIPGTALSCFDKTNGFKPLPRNTGTDPI